MLRFYLQIVQHNLIRFRIGFPFFELVRAKYFLEVSYCVGIFYIPHLTMNNVCICQRNKLVFLFQIDKQRVDSIIRVKV